MSVLMTPLYLCVTTVWIKQEPLDIQEKNAHLVGHTAADSHNWNTRKVKSIILMFALTLPPAGFVQCIPLLVCKEIANSPSLISYGFINFYHPLQPSLVQTEDSQSVHCFCLSQLLCQHFIWFCCILVLYKNGLESCHCVILNLTTYSNSSKVSFP